MKRQRMNNKGFTLIETTIAMLVMMVVGLSATSLFLYSVRYNSGASQRSVAMAVAQQRLEVLRGSTFNDAGLSFGTHPPQTVVIAPGSTTGYTPTDSSIAGNESFEAPAAAASAADGFYPATQPTPSPGVGTTGSAPSGSNTFQIQTQVDPFPIGASAASATQKRITIRVVPINGNGNNAWENQSPVEVVFHRSAGTPGPYKQ